jgi:hypothetical protein
VQTTTENGIVRNAEGRIIAFTREFYTSQPCEEIEYVDEDGNEENPALPKGVGSEVDAVEEPGLFAESKKVVKFKFKRALSKPSSFRSDEEPSHVD